MVDVGLTAYGWLSDPTNSYKVLWARELGACHKSG